MFKVLSQLLEAPMPIRLTEHQKTVLCAVHTAPTPKLAYDYTVGNWYYVESRKFLIANGFIQSPTVGTLSLTNSGFDMLVSSGIIEHDGELTDYGQELLSSAESD